MRWDDPELEDNLTFFCDGYAYEVRVESAKLLVAHTAMRDLYARTMHHVSFVLTYDASSRESWDEMVANYQDICNRFENGVTPFPTMMAAMGEGPVSRGEAESFASQRGCLFAQYSPATNQGVRDAFASLVELANATRVRYATDPNGFKSAVDSTARAIHTLFS
jgi:hypothetical protein